MGYSFCESVWATSVSRWHIRKLTSKGRKLGGGADTEALCGLTVAWDLNSPISDAYLQHACPECARAYNDIVHTQKETRCVNGEIRLISNSRVGDRWL